MPRIIILDDLAGPILSNPTDVKTGSDTANLGVDTTKDNGIAYWVVTTSPTPPSESDIQAGTGAVVFDNAAVSTLGTQSFAVTGLTESTLYYGHFVHVDVSGNVSNVASGDGFTTDSAGDTTAPVLTGPTATPNGQGAASVSVTTDEGNGTLYAVASTSATQPTAAQIRAGQIHTGAAAPWDDSVAVFSAGQKTLTASGLTGATEYYIHWTQRDAAGNDATVVTSAAFTTWPNKPANQTLTPGSGNWVAPAATEFYRARFTLKGPGASGEGGGGGDTSDCCGHSGDSGESSNSGSGPTTFGSVATIGVQLVANRGASTNGTALNGDTNTTGGANNGGNGGSGGDGANAEIGGCDDGDNGSSGSNGKHGGLCIKTFAPNAIVPATAVPYVVGSGGALADGGDKGSGSGCGLFDWEGDDGDPGLAGGNGSILIEFLDP